MSISVTTGLGMVCVATAAALVGFGARGSDGEVAQQEVGAPRGRLESRERRSGSVEVVWDRSELARDDRSLATQIYVKGSVTVGGHVASPGSVSFSSAKTLGEAIERAGGATPFGSLRRVRLHRAGKLYEYDLKETNGAEVAVLPHDMIEVPQKMIFGRSRCEVGRSVGFAERYGTDRLTTTAETRS